MILNPGPPISYPPQVVKHGGGNTGHPLQPNLQKCTSPNGKTNTASHQGGKERKRSSEKSKERGRGNCCPPQTGQDFGLHQQSSGHLTPAFARPPAGTRAGGQQAYNTHPSVTVGGAKGADTSRRTEERGKRGWPSGEKWATGDLARPTTGRARTTSRTPPRRGGG